MKKIFIIFLFVFFLFSCNGNSSNISVDKDKKTIYTSFYPVYFLTKTLLGDGVNIINLVPSGGEPHDFEPTLKQIGDMKKSDLIVINGLGMENYEEKLIQNVGSGKVYIISENIPNLINISQEDHHEDEEEHGHEHGNIDPHTWLSPKSYVAMAELLNTELEKRGYTTDISVIENLKSLDKDYENSLKNCSQKEIVTSHEAFGYLARDYNFLQHPIFGISPEEEPSTKDIANVIDLIKKDNLKYIFSEEFVSPKFSNTIKNETGVEVLTLHPLETLSPLEEENNENYLSVMQKNLEMLKTGLDCK